MLGPNSLNEIIISLQQSFKLNSNNLNIKSPLQIKIQWQNLESMRMISLNKVKQMIRTCKWTLKARAKDNSILEWLWRGIKMEKKLNAKDQLRKKSIICLKKEVLPLIIQREATNKMQSIMKRSLWSSRRIKSLMFGENIYV